jgi:anaphase-promoting complex subunit 10
LHFFKLVAIVKMRIYLDFELDESYTPTKMKFYAGMSEGGLVEFGTWEVTETTDPDTGETHCSIEGVRGWIDVPLKGVGGRETRWHGNSDVLDGDGEPTLYPALSELEEHVPGDVLKAMVVQVQICENHQNGKDTHVRGFQVFARDYANPGEVMTTKRARKEGRKGKVVDDPDEDVEKIVKLQPADWMGDAEIR